MKRTVSRKSVESERAEAHTLGRISIAPHNDGSRRVPVESVQEDGDVDVHQIAASKAALVWNAMAKHLFACFSAASPDGKERAMNDGATLFTLVQMDFG